MGPPSFLSRVSRTSDLQLFYWRHWTSVSFHLKLLKTSGETHDKLFNLVLQQSSEYPTAAMSKIEAMRIFTYSDTAFDLSALGRGLTSTGTGRDPSQFLRQPWAQKPLADLLDAYTQSTQEHYSKGTVSLQL